jgi:exosortase A-associated hydrolase 2
MSVAENTIENPSMTSPGSGPFAVGSFFSGSRGRLYLLDYPAAWECRGTILYVNPFAAEASHSRRVIARLARLLSQKNYRVVIVDHYGCGDSEGNFEDARWEIWREDLLSICRWLGASGCERIILCGLRMGALLAAEVATLSPLPLERLVLIQPVLNGAALLSQFVRSHLQPEDLPSDMALKLSDTEQRRALSLGSPVNIDGYMLAPELIRTVDSLKLEPLGAVIHAPIHWLRILKDKDEQPSAGSQRVIQNWRGRGLRVDTSDVFSWPFWTIATVAGTEDFFRTLPPAFPNA